MGNHRQTPAGDHANLTQSPIIGNAPRQEAWSSIVTQAGELFVCAISLLTEAQQY